MPEKSKTKSNVNFREGPGTHFKVISVLKPDTAVTVHEQHGDWLKVEVAGRTGFVHGKFVWLASNEIASGFLIDQADAGDWKLVPEQRRSAPPGAGSAAKLTARIWNSFGGLLETLSARLGIDPGVAVAVVATESSGSGFQNGRMIIRFENHHFWRHWGRTHPETFAKYFAFDANRPWTKHRFRPAAAKPWLSFHGKQETEWLVFEHAQSLDDRAAKLSISMGLPQIMGSNHALIGYDSVEDMFAAFSTDERIQLIGLFDFIKGPNTSSDKVTALQRKDFVAFAALYNGKGQAAAYGEILERYYDAYLTLTPAV